MKRVAADQSVIDRAFDLQAEGKTDAEIARELGVTRATPSKWRKQGRLPERVKKKDQPRQGQVRGAPAGSDRQSTPGRVAHHRGARAST